jgi:putative membrane protein
MRLVVCVDRDDDLGRKAGVLGPVVGRAAVLEAAQKLGIADPEDSDTNAMYGAIRLLDELRSLGEEVDVVLLTGSPKVGVLSDRKVGEQFDRVLAQVPAEGVHLISDGAEDEYILPVLQSRVKIDGVHRIYVRQSASLESTYYTVLTALKDQKLRNKTVLPFAIALLVVGIAAATGVFWWGITALLILLGVYLIFWVFDIDEALIDSIRSASSDIRTGSVAFGFGLLAIALAAIGALLGYNSWINTHPASATLERGLAFPAAGLIWWLVAGELWETGRAIRWYLARSRIPSSYLIATTSIIGIGLISFGILQLVNYLESFPSQPILIVGLLLGVGLGCIISAGVLFQYLRPRSGASSAPA